MQQKDLEKVIDIKIKQLVDKAMHNTLGMTITEIESEISDKLKNGLFFEIEITTALPFKKAKKLFKKQYVARLCRLHFGNISEVAAIAGIDRRSVHRIVTDLKIGITDFREEAEKISTYNKQTFVEEAIKDAITPYKTSINPIKFKALYKQAPTLSSDIAKALPDVEITYKTAEQEFEKIYLTKALQENNGNISKTAKKIGVRFETLHRKMKKLGIV